MALEPGIIIYLIFLILQVLEAAVVLAVSHLNSAWVHPTFPRNHGTLLWPWLWIWLPDEVARCCFWLVVENQVWVRGQALSHWISRVWFVVVSVRDVAKVLGLVDVYVLLRMELVGLEVQLILAAFGRVDDMPHWSLVLNDLAVVALHHEVVVSWSTVIHQTLLIFHSWNWRVRAMILKNWSIQEWKRKLTEKRVKGYARKGKLQNSYSTYFS